VLLPLSFVMAEPAQVERLVYSLFPRITSVKTFYADEALNWPWPHVCTLPDAVNVHVHKWSLAIKIHPNLVRTNYVFGIQ